MVDDPSSPEGMTNNPDNYRIVLIIEEGLLFSSGWATDILERLRDEIIQIIQIPPPAGHEIRQNITQNAKYIGVVPWLKLVSMFIWRKILALLPAVIVGSRRSRLVHVARQFGKPFDILLRLNDPQSRAFLAGLNADVFITSVSEHLLDDVLSIPRAGCLNKHAALLPGYGGLMPIFQAIAHGEIRVGMTIHQMTGAIDEGRVLCQRPVPVEDGDTVWSLSVKAYGLIGEAVEHAVMVLKGQAEPETVEPRPQKSYFSLPTEENWRAFRDRGIPFI